MTENAKLRTPVPEEECKATRLESAINPRASFLKRLTMTKRYKTWERIRRKLQTQVHPPKIVSGDEQGSKSPAFPYTEVLSRLWYSLSKGGQLQVLLSFNFWWNKRWPNCALAEIFQHSSKSPNDIPPQVTTNPHSIYENHKMGHNSRNLEHLKKKNQFHL